ncbi:MAG: MBL fold metallo-hydrolase [Rhodobacteraceae bacterium]|nr:MBL fold metallo-hydrolase [Paracoccaceae bacterium]
MKITWYGQACFAIESRDALRIYTDPYDPEKTGFKPFIEPADIVIKSSSNDDYHDNDHLVPRRKDASVIDALQLALDTGRAAVRGIEFRAIEAMESLDHPSGHPDQNAMYRFTIDGLSIGHMGDMGNPFSDDQMAFFEGCDVLLSHAGGFPVIEIAELQRIIAHLKPPLVIPMHFRTLCYKPQNMHFITEFLQIFAADQVDFACTSSIELTTADLPDSTRALVLSYV